MKFHLISLFLPLLLGCTATVDPPKDTSVTVDLPQATVVSVGDGDTFRARDYTDKAVTIRVGCVDAPESQQAWGPQQVVAGETRGFTAGVPVMVGLGMRTHNGRSWRSRGLRWGCCGR